ncbi:MAG: pantetheine-phosphate adenylyltransferase [Candidatus Micrarchaeota archaeon]|nr:pantetheine-phosphate adenylyltransferase [Candidatus Micrarchaeota archaeon]
MAKGHCILGGTFTYVHAGHEGMLSACRKFSRVSIGLTSDAFVKRNKIYPSFPYARRLAGLKAALKKTGVLPRCEIFKIENEAGGADRNKAADTIIVSEETESAAVRINRQRKKNSLRPLKIITVPLLYGDDLKKISNVAIYEGKTDLHGRLRVPLRIQVATDNPTKRKGTATALRRIFGSKFTLNSHSEDSRVPAHPFDNQTFEGARNRAVAAWKRANGAGKGSKCDYSLGIESGLFSRMHPHTHIDITIACVYDGKTETYGTGMGFVVPEQIAKKIKRDKSDLSVALAEITGIERIGWKQGALGWFSKGKMHRAEQIEAAVTCAFVPRVAVAKLGMEY